MDPAAASSSSRHPREARIQVATAATNYDHDDVQAYNVDLAVAAAKLGVDDVLYDYGGSRTGLLESMVVPGLEGDSRAVVVPRAHGSG